MNWLSALLGALATGLLWLFDRLVVVRCQQIRGDLRRVAVSRQRDRWEKKYRALLVRMQLRAERWRREVRNGHAGPLDDCPPGGGRGPGLPPA